MLYNGSQTHHTAGRDDRNTTTLAACVLAQHDYLISKEYEIQALMFDGLMVYGFHYDNNELLLDIEEHVLGQTEYSIKLSYKPHSTELKIPTDFETPDSIYQKEKTLFELTNCKIEDTFIHMIVGAAIGAIASWVLEQHIKEQQEEAVRQAEEKYDAKMKQKHDDFLVDEDKRKNNTRKKKRLITCLRHNTKKK